MAADQQATFEEYLARIEDILEHSKTAAFSDQVKVDKNEIYAVLKEIRSCMPQELERARWIMEEKDRILEDAEKEAQKRLEQAETERRNRIDEHEITQQAYTEAEAIVSKAQDVAREIKRGAREYADDILEQVDDQMGRMGEFTSVSISKILKELQTNVDSFGAALGQKRQILQNNRKELNVDRSGSKQ